MATVLGSPERRGKSDVVGSYKLQGAETGNATQVEEGLFVGLSGDKEHVSVNAGTPIGVTGKGHGNVSVAVVESGKTVWVQADSAIGTPVIGKQVFVTPAGQASDTDNSSANTAVAATFASAEVRDDGVTTNIKGKWAYNRKCVCINFLGGL
ncbi:MAG: hypothetical protein E7011_02090 [Alphaproteobacteria bacterium]|nr:hypothetical protein [Alphaproteobacteria bacterium]